MGAAELTTILSSVLQSGAVITFVVLLFRGLKQNIEGLKGTILAQHDTLKAMESRIKQTEEIKDLYKNFIADLPGTLSSYKDIVINARDDLVSEINGLRSTVLAQQETLQTIDRRAEEERKIGEIYKNLLDGLPAQVDSYKRTIETIKGDLVQELAKANSLKDNELKRLYEVRIEEVNKLEALISGVPALRNELVSMLDDLQDRFENLNQMEAKSGFLVREYLQRISRRL